MRPHDRIGHALARCEHQRNVAGPVAVLFDRSAFDELVGNVEGDRQRNADAHHQAALGQRVDCRARNAPSEQRHEPDGGCRQQREHGKRDRKFDGRRAVGNTGCDRPCEDRGEVDADLAHMQHALGDGCRIRATLPQHRFALRQHFGQAADGFEIAIVVAFGVRAHITGSEREGSE